MLVTNIDKRYNTGSLTVQSTQERADLVEAIDLLLARQNTKLSRLVESDNSFRSETDKLARFQIMRNAVNAAVVNQPLNMVRQYLWDLVLALESKVVSMELDGTSVSQSAKFDRMKILLTTSQNYNTDFVRTIPKPSWVFGK